MPGLGSGIRCFADSFNRSCYEPLPGRCCMTNPRIFPVTTERIKGEIRGCGISGERTISRFWDKIPGIRRERWDSPSGPAWMRCGCFRPP